MPWTRAALLAGAVAIALNMDRANTEPVPLARGQGHNVWLQNDTKIYKKQLVCTCCVHMLAEPNFCKSIKFIKRTYR